MTKDATMVAAKRELVDRERGWRIGGIVVVIRGIERASCIRKRAGCRVMPLCQLCWWVLAGPFKIALDTLPFTLTCIELYAGEHDAQLHGRAVLFCVDLMNPVVSVDFVRSF